jgi:hypothetical protein
MFPTWQRILLGLLVLACCLFGSGESAAVVPVNPPEEIARPISFPDGVLDSAHRTAFVSSPKGGIQAIRLEDGKVLWTNDEFQAQPWLVAGERLIARGDRLLVLDLKHEGKVKPCDALLFPKVTIPDRCTVAFQMWDPRVNDATLEARWYAVANIDRSKGRPFAFEAWTTFNKAVPVGTIKVNLENGRCDVQTDPKPVDVTGPLLPEVARPEQRLAADLPEKLKAVCQQYHKDQNGRITVLDGRLIGVAMLLEKAGAEYRKKVVLNAWDLKTAAAAEPVELLADSAQAIANVGVTGDHRHATVQFNTSALAIYSLADGKRVTGGVVGVLSPEEAFVEGKRLYHERATGKAGDRNLTALDLDSGKLVWERSLKPRSTVPLPPRITPVLPGAAP